MFQHAITHKKERQVEHSFDGSILENEEYASETEVWRERIKVVFRHDTKNKRYEALIRKCKASERNGFQIEQHALFTDPLVYLQFAPAARFSQKSFDAFCTEMRGVCIELVNDESCDNDAAKLLRQAVDYHLVKN
jgi:hypothetical protein